MSRPDSELAHLFRQLKAPAAANALPKLADRARAEQWSYEQFIATVLKTETDSRDSHGGQSRIKAARFPARKSWRSSTSRFKPACGETGAASRPVGLPRRQGEHRAARTAGTGKTHIATSLGIRACLAGQRVQFATATQWVARLGEAKRQGQLEAELRRLSFIPLIIVDEVGYIPFDPEAANLMFASSPTATNAPR